MDRSALSGLLVVGVVVLVGSVLPVAFADGRERLLNVDLLLTTVAAVATLAGVGFAFYGWLAARELPRLVERRVRAELTKWRREFQSSALRQQEALQKVMASYALTDPDRRIALLEQASRVDPDVYNVYVALGYAYWEKGNLERAQQCFREDFRRHPDSYQSACDLAALYAAQGEWLAALDWMREALHRNPSCAAGLENDPRLAPLRDARPEAFRRLIEGRRR